MKKYLLEPVRIINYKDITKNLKYIKPALEKDCSELTCHNLTDTTILVYINSKIQFILKSFEVISYNIEQHGLYFPKGSKFKIKYLDKKPTNGVVMVQMVFNCKNN